MSTPFSIDFKASIDSLKSALGQDRPWGAVNLLSPAGMIFFVSVFKFMGAPLDMKMGVIVSIQTIVTDIFAGMLTKEHEMTRILAGAVVPFALLIYMDLSPFKAATYIIIETVTRRILHASLSTK